VRFSYNATTGQITANRTLFTAPSLGPRVVATSRDGSYFMTGWVLFGCGAGFLGDCTAAGPLLAQWPNATGPLNVGSISIRSSKGLIYAQMTQQPPKPTDNSQTVCLPNGTCVKVVTPGAATTTSSVPPNLLIMDADNLTVRDRIQLSETLAGRSVFYSDESVMYSISDSGVTVFPMAQLDQAPRVVPSQEDVVFRGNFCNSGPITQQLDVVDPAGNATPFQIWGSNSCSAAGILISPSSGVTSAHVKISIDPTVIGGPIGTREFKFEISSTAAVNKPASPTRGQTETSYTTNTRSRFRILVNIREPENRGSFFDAPGELVDLNADPARSRLYVLSQDKNQVLVYDGTNYSLLSTLRIGNTPTSIASTSDRRYLLVGNGNSEIANRYDLDSLSAVQPIVFRLGHYPRSIAVSGKAILAASRVAGPANTIDQVDLVSSTASLPLVFVSSTQINAQLPAVLTEGAHNVIVRWEGKPETAAPVSLVRNAPGLFKFGQPDQAIGLFLRADGSAVTPDHPASARETISVVGTGLGPYAQQPPDGFLLDENSGYTLADPVTVIIADDTTLEPVYAGRSGPQSGCQMRPCIRSRSGSATPKATWLGCQFRSR
jgi:uncharacterized protein (TIGR03437 family)